MVFSSLTFLLYFLPIVLSIYYLVPKKGKNLVLFLSSMFFYFLGEPKYVVLMLLSIISTYTFGRLIESKENHKKAFMILSICISLGLLVFFKYTDFIIQNINGIFGGSFNLLRFALPIGISFYTFQEISYIIDVYKGEVKAQKNFLNLATYVSLFPQLIAGPIVRYKDLDKELNDREYKVENFSNGVRRFVIGLSKKIIIANVLAELVTVCTKASEPSVLFYWMYAIAVTLQIYMDFSGYSDMAIGIGKMLGFKFPENFNYPYIATSVTDFWRRWHMTLGTWFKDYVYIPLGGNRVSKIKWFRNIFIVWALTGLWHGASWNFVIWGLLYGVLLVIEKLGLLKVLQKIPKMLSRIYVMFVVMIGFVIFNSTNISEIITNIGGLFGFGNIPLVSKESLFYFKDYASILLIGAVFSTPIFKNIIEKIQGKKENIEIKNTEKDNENNIELNSSNNEITMGQRVINILEPVILLVLLVVCISYLVDGSFNPFLYFRF